MERVPQLAGGFRVSGISVHGVEVGNGERTQKQAFGFQFDVHGVSFQQRVIFIRMLFGRICARKR